MTATQLSGAAARDASTAGEGWTSNVAFWLILHVVAWTIYATISNAPGDIHHDMAEAYSWGREFQWGYHKHPPFWAWITGLWFSVLPRANWAFYMLAMVNAALGLWAVWRIAGRYLQDPRARLAAMLLLELTPFPHFLAFKFNANTVLISLWAWTIYFFLRLIEDRDQRAAIWLGLIAGAGLLSKYYFGVLLLGFGIAALADPRRLEIIRSPGPWIAVAIMLALFAPHVWWLPQNGYGPLRYMADFAGYTYAFVVWKAVQFAIGCILFHVVVVAVLAGFSAPPRTALARVLDWRGSTTSRQRLLILTLTPWAGTILIALAFNLRVDTNFAIGIFPLTPLLLLTTPGYRLDVRAYQWLPRIVCGLIAVMLLASPVIAYVRFALRADDLDLPRSEAVRALQAAWDREIGAPLRIAGGAYPHGSVASFYARGEVSQFVGLSRQQAPWITEERLRRDGAAILCLTGDAACIAQARAVLGASLKETSFAARKHFLGRDGRGESFVALMRPPDGSR